MKITKTQLRQIIKEELEKTLKEPPDCKELELELSGLYTDVGDYATPGSPFHSPGTSTDAEKRIQLILTKCPHLEDRRKGKTSSGLRSMGADRYGE